MPPPKLSYGLNLAKKGNTSGAKRKALFDDSDDEDQRSGANETGAIEITTLGGIDGDPTTTREEDADTRPVKRKAVPLGQGPKPKVKPLSRASIFADDDEDENGNAKGSGGGPEKLNNTGGTTYGLTKSAEREYTNLSAMHSSKKHAAEAQELDPSIYAYDAVYESLKAKPEQNKTQAADSAAAEGPRYMTSLLRSAEIRKRDQLRARDRMLTREREAEGDEFKDKEKFVTAAYKAQQEEMRRVEEEEAAREREEEERRKKNGGAGMVGFYRDLLTRGEQQHEAVMRAADEAAKKMKDGAGLSNEEAAAAAAAAEEEEKTEARLVEELKARGANIAVNDDGQVVDKRQLLSAGLNVASKPKQAASARTSGVAGAGATAGARPDARQVGGARAAQRARQTEMIAAQLEEQERQREEAEAARQKEIAERSRSRKSATEVSSAKERYLARKREREAAAKAS